jgi:hypothetical protein
VIHISSSVRAAFGKMRRVKVCLGQSLLLRRIKRNLPTYVAHRLFCATSSLYIHSACVYAALRVMCVRLVYRYSYYPYRMGHWCTLRITKLPVAYGAKCATDIIRSAPFLKYATGNTTTYSCFSGSGRADAMDVDQQRGWLALLGTPNKIGRRYEAGWRAF